MAPHINHIVDWAEAAMNNTDPQHFNPHYNHCTQEIKQLYQLIKNSI